MPNAVHYLHAVERDRARAVFLAWKAQFPAMGVFALLPEPEAPAVATLQSLATEVDVPIFGGIFPALIVERGFRNSGCLLLRFDEAPFTVFSDPITNDGQHAAIAEQIGAQIAAQVAATDDECTLFMLFDAMVPVIGSMLDALYLELADRVHYAGASAGSESFQPLPCLFDRTRFLGDRALFLLLRDHHGAILEHGYCLPERTYLATTTEGNRITHIDWRPAFDVYCELAQTHYDVAITRDNFYRHAVHLPFGIVRANHNILVRIPTTLHEDGSIGCAGEIPPHSMLTLLGGPAVDTHDTVDALVERVSRLNGDVAGRNKLLFYCAGRRLHLGLSEAESELSELHRRSRCREIAGALSLGEIGASTLWGYPLFHNAALVAALW